MMHSPFYTVLVEKHASFSPFREETLGALLECSIKYAQGCILNIRIAILQALFSAAFLMQAVYSDLST